MADLQQFNQLRVVDASGVPSPGAKAYFYTPGTTSLVDVYADEALTVLHPSPLVADASGVFAPVWTNGTVKVNVTSSTGATLPGYPLDPAPRSSGEEAAAGDVSFAPTALLPYSNVQAAVNALATRVGDVSPLGKSLIGKADAEGALGMYDDLGFPDAVASQLNAIGSNAVTLTNWDNINGTGAWWGAATATNPPVASTAFSAVSVMGNAGGNITVLAMRHGSNEIWMRRKASGTWAGWAKVYPSGLGFDQTWQDVAASRVSATSYQNTTGKPIAVFVKTGSTSPQTLDASVDGVTWVSIGETLDSGSDKREAYGIIPTGQYYRLTAGSVTRWVELR